MLGSKGNSSSDESMMAMDSKVAVQPVLKTQEPIHPLSLTEQLDQMIEIVKWLDNIWDTDPELWKEIDKTDWKEFMNTLNEMQADIYKKWKKQQEELYGHKLRR